MKKFLSISALIALFSLPSLAVPFMLDNAQSKVDFTIKHLQLKNVDGKFEKFNADIDFDPSAKKLNKLIGEVEVASVNTANTGRDDHLRANDIFDSAKYPKMTFVMTKCEKGKISGNLTIKGVTKPVSFDAKKEFDGKMLKINAQTQIKRSDFGVVWESNLKDSLVSDELTIKLNITAKQ